ncbi:hypothetical protein [Rhizobium sp. FKL33]|uniref:hypothetical protein n=1 Tax=Rhizobium sp. FKL33 TaxID=2562307 RepID=UPI00148544E8|nr:hypothetical protein [Rhizobium sp. FKL33]
MTNPRLAPRADSPDHNKKRMALGKGLLVIFLAFAAMMFALYATILIWTGIAAA